MYLEKPGILDEGYTRGTTEEAMAAKPKRAPARDALTGAPLSLTPASMVFPVRDPDARPLPKRIDTREPFHTNGGTPPDGGLGGKEWSRDFERYIRPVLPASMEEAVRRWEAWWTFPIVVARLRVRMGEEKLQAALLFCRDGWDIHRIARRLNHTSWWVGQAKGRAVYLVRRHYLPYSYLDRHLAGFAGSLAGQ
jgi:hypothetical protein